MEKKLYDLTVDPELETFMPPLSDNEKKALETDILANGCRTPLIVWNGIIIDGHHRYAICKKNGIPFGIEQQEFANRDEAKLWMFQEQFSRRNLGTVARVVKALELKPILLEKGKEKQGHRSDLDNLFKRTKSHDTRKMIAEIADASPTMVYKIEKIREVADAETMEALIREKIKVSSTYNRLCRKPQEAKPEENDIPCTTNSTSCYQTEAVEEEEAACPDDYYTDNEIRGLVQEIIGDLQDGIEELIEQYNVGNYTSKMTIEILSKLGKGFRKAEKQACQHLMNLPLQRELLFPQNGENLEEIVAVHNEVLRSTGLGDLVLPELKEY